MRRRALTILMFAMAASASAEVINIDTHDLKELIAAGVPVVDVRTAPEWQQTGVIAGSRLLTFFDANGRYDAAAWLSSLQSIAPAGRPVILICRTGNRTSTISSFLSQQGLYPTVYNVQGGIVHWVNGGNPTVRPDSPSQ